MLSKKYTVILIAGLMLMLFYDFYFIFEALYIQPDYERFLRISVIYVLLLNYLVFLNVFKLTGENSLFNPFQMAQVVITLFAIPSSIAGKYYVAYLYDKTFLLNGYDYFISYQLLKLKVLKYFFLPKIAWIALVFHMYLVSIKSKNVILNNMLGKLDEILLSYLK